jgi:hypothetical protein
MPRLGTESDASLVQWLCSEDSDAELILAEDVCNTVKVNYLRYSAATKAMSE